MKIAHLRPAAAEPCEDTHDALLSGLLEVLLCGLGAAAALMILFSVLPKSGDGYGDMTSDVGRLLNRAELFARRQKSSIEGHTLTLVQVQAPPGSGVRPEDVQVRNLPSHQSWIEGDEATGWLRTFVASVPLETETIPVVCAPGTGQYARGENARLSVRVRLDGLLAAVTAQFIDPPTMNGLRESAGNFQLVAQPGSPALPPQPLGAAPNVPVAEALPIVTIHPWDPIAPLTGVTK